MAKQLCNSPVQIYVVIRMSQGWIFRRLKENGKTVYRISEYKHNGAYRYVYPRTLKCMVRDRLISRFWDEYFLTAKGHSVADRHRNSPLLTR